MSWIRRSLCVLFLLLAASASYAARIDPAQFPGSHQARDMSFFWNVQEQPDSIVIKGLARNDFYHKVYQLQIFAAVLDENGKPVGKEAIFIGPPALPLDQSQPFTLKIPVASSVDRKNIRVEYRYHLPSYAERHWSWTYGRFGLTPEGTGRS